MLTKRLRVTIFAAAAALAASGSVAQTAEPARTFDTAKGKTLVDPKGMTLYVFDKDTAGKSACNGACATNWPPLTAAADAKAANGFTIVTREDGSKQWAYRAKPLYTWAKDTKPGDITGDGLNGNTWHVAVP